MESHARSLGNGLWSEEWYQVGVYTGFCYKLFALVVSFVTQKKKSNIFKIQFSLVFQIFSPEWNDSKKYSLSYTPG